MCLSWAQPGAGPRAAVFHFPWQEWKLGLLPSIPVGSRRGAHPILQGVEICLSLKNRNFEGTQHSRGHEAYSHPQIPRAGDGWTTRAPHSDGAVHA